MKTTKFKADNGTQVVEGVLILGKNKSEVIFDTTLEEFEDTTLKQSNIKDVNNFVAALIARFDSNKYFETVKVGRKDVSILRKDKYENTETVYVQGKGLNKSVFSNSTADITDRFGDNVVVKLDVTPVVIPKDFQYTNDQALNKVLRANVVPFDYYRHLNKEILKTIKGFKNGLIKEDAKIFIDKYGRVTSSELRAFVIIDKFLI